MNMKMHEARELKEKFIELRGFQECSLDKCSQELGVSKPTLIKWESKLNQEITRLRKANLTVLVDEYELSIAKRLERLRRLSERLYDAIEKQDLAYIDEDKLVKLYLDVSDKVQDLTNKFRLTNSDSMDIIQIL